ncbi:Calcium-dependent lipid-binding (CaLB domain) family protein [Abeliophyllum distichum]|uniref:Calcium-dependent lipid-binding (CaLB domain) family protein n=1 Tax=Abeliophyllum distichum TaxID=126358 RepID=A0ABD1P0P5_9LAMI
MATASLTSPPAPSKLYNLDITIVNAKHLKNVNRRQGDHRPYIIFWVDPDRLLATKHDDSETTRPVWNEQTSKPLVGTLRIELRDLLVDSNESSIRVKSNEVKRPSGWPHCKIRLKLSLRERSNDNYQTAPPSSYIYSTARSPPLPTYPGRDYGGYSSAPYSSLPVVHQPPSMSSPPPPPAPQSFSYTYSDPYLGYYPGYYSQVPSPPPPWPFFDRQSSYGGPGPSTPVDYQKRGSEKFGMGGMGSGLTVGAVARALWRAGIGRRDKVRGREDS